MATRRRPQSRQRTARRAPSSSSSQQAIYVGIGAVVVLALVIVFVGSGGGKTGAGGDTAKPVKVEKSSPPAKQPAVAKPGGMPGKTPDTPAPELTDDTLRKLDELYREAKDKYNASVRARSQGDNSGAREAASEARQFLEQWKATVQENLDWQEYAQMEDWAQPAAYMALERKFQAYATLNKKVRMGGG